MKAGVFCFFVVGLLLTACEKTETSGYTDWPIVEAYLSPGDYVRVKISRQLPFLSDVGFSDDELDNLSILLIHNEIVTSLMSVGNGLYVDSSVVVEASGVYELSFVFNNKSVTAYTFIPAKPIDFAQSATEIEVGQMGGGASGPPSTPPSMPEPIQLTWNNPTGAHYLVVVETMEEEPEAIFEFEDENRPAPRFRKQPVTSSGLVINSREFQYFGMHRVILFHVLPDYAALYEENNSTSQNLTNPSTSIENGYGIFTGLNSDTLFINVKKAAS